MRMIVCMCVTIVGICLMCWLFPQQAMPYGRINEAAVIHRTVIIDGHKYITVTKNRLRSGACIIHAESCKCLEINR